MADHPVLHAIIRQGFLPLGWFAPDRTDCVPEGTRFMILIGNAGPGMFRRFCGERDPERDLLDDWCREKIGNLAKSLEAHAVFPFDTPALPFLSWARRGGAGHISPLGLNIHPLYGLWHAYRAALLFDVAFDLPTPHEGAHPCESCSDKPCLSACPVSAFGSSGYAIDRCTAHLVLPDGGACMGGGCLARHACPIGRAFAYETGQASFHMRAFLKSRLAAQQQSV